MSLVVGLRNPEAAYDGTRHNIGAVAVEVLARRHDASFGRARQGVRAEVAEVNLDGNRSVLTLPTTAMNHSGQAIAPVVRYFGVAHDHLVLVHDDIDVPFGKLKMQWAGGHGGHNGIRSAVGSLKTNEFWRLKIGVGRPPGRQDPADFVLSRFATAERDDIGVTVYRAADVIERFIREGGPSARQFAGEQNT
ncbi:MAG TPA: aminoacyl-tRNA hydrolase [Acidimicrobiia bacterium]|nr:aminoacyl-tRNA hydrolase [Acidimicrobiia bacterium]